MTNLIKIGTSDISGQQKETINARELHQFVESKQEFANWIKNRIAKYGFIENDDYLTNLSNRIDKKAGKKRIDYLITLDMAKELSMIENNDKGRQIRKYFIACEKQLLQSQPDEVKKLQTQNRLLTWLVNERNIDLDTHCKREQFLYNCIVESGIKLPEMIV